MTTAAFRRGSKWLLILVGTFYANAQRIVAAEIEISPQATADEAETARAFFKKHGGPRFFGYGGLDPKVLHLLDRKLTNATISPVAHMVGLQELFIAGISITDDGLAHLAGLRKLKSLSISGTGSNSKELRMPLTGAGLAYLAMLPELEELWLNQLPIEPRHLANLARIKGLKQLWISERATLDGKRLWETGTSADKVLDGLKELEGLDLFRFQTQDKSATAAGFARWKSADSLTSLTIEGLVIEKEGWSSFRRFRSLESLCYKAPVNYIDWDVLATLPDLRELRLDRIKDDALEGIHKCKQVRTLHLGHSVTDAGVRHLTNMSNLESLTMWFSRIDGNGFSDGENLKSLRLLVLYGSQLNDEGLAHAAKLPALEGISFERTRVTPQGMKALLQAKKTLKRVTPTEPVYTAGAELDNPYFRVAEEIKKLAPDIKFDFSVDAPP